VRQRPLNVNNARTRSKLIKIPMPNQKRHTDTINDAKRKKDAQQYSEKTKNQLKSRKNAPSSKQTDRTD